MTATQTLLDRLGALDIAAIDFHAQRYDSADIFRSAIKAARDDAAWLARNIATGVPIIARACEGDGAAYGFIPCLGGPHLEVWKELLRAYGDPAQAAEALRLYGRE